MKKLIILLVLSISVFFQSLACEKCKIYDNNPDFKIISASVILNKKFRQLEFIITVEGVAGKTLPTPVGKLDV